MGKENWTKNALCAGLPTDWWFPKKGNALGSIVRTSLACTICSLCSEVENCAKTFESLPTQQKIGIWGGTNKKVKKKIALGETKLEFELKKIQQKHVSRNMQNVLTYSACADKKVLAINSWVLEEIKAKQVTIAPKRTEAQILEALVEAGRCRSIRKDVKLKINMGEIGLLEVFKMADSEKAIAGIKIKDIIKSYPGIGEGFATEILLNGNISLKRRIKGLGKHQRQYLLQHPKLKY